MTRKEENAGIQNRYPRNELLGESCQTCENENILSFRNYNYPVYVKRIPAAQIEKKERQEGGIPAGLALYPRIKFLGSPLSLAGRRRYGELLKGNELLSGGVSYLRLYGSTVVPSLIGV